MKLILKWIITNIGVYSIKKHVKYSIKDVKNTYNINMLSDDFYLSKPFDITFNNIYTLANMSELAYRLDDNIPVENSSIRAFLFSTEDYSTNVIAIKGTTPAFLGNLNKNNNIELTFQKDIIDEIQPYKSMISNTSKNDKLNDNLLFSCCFYKQSNLFNDHCSYKIPSDNNKCSCDCYKNSTYVEGNYYNTSIKIVHNIMDLIDFYNSTVIFTGHSLGGAIATFLGLRFNKTVVTFETPGEKHFLAQFFTKSQFFNLLKRQDLKIYHFGHNADPIVTGKCGNTCWLLGYNINTKCHIGYTCIYDSQAKLKMSQFIWRHRLKWVIDYILPYWQTDFPECIYNMNCTDCDNWTYI